MPTARWCVMRAHKERTCVKQLTKEGVWQLLGDAIEAAMPEADGPFHETDVLDVLLEQRLKVCPPLLPSQREPRAT